MVDYYCVLTGLILADSIESARSVIVNSGVVKCAHEITGAEDIRKIVQHLYDNASSTLKMHIRVNNCHLSFYQRIN